MEQKLFSKDFTLVVIGQVISLFGNAAIRFALPLYLLNHTGSSALFGMVTACAFIPAVLLSPIGGMVADRVNKRNIMVVLDFFTAMVITLFSLLLDRGSLVLSVAATMMLLYGIAGAYQPSVQASVPALVAPGHYMQANSVINTISSFSSLLGPALGGILYSAYGLKPVLWICIACFLASALIELFIRIPFEKRDSGVPVWKLAVQDFKDSVHFIRAEKPVIGKGLLVICTINLCMSAMIVVALPYMVTEVLPLDAGLANQLYGFAQGALAAGGLAGGIGAGVFARKLSIQNAGNLLIICAGCIVPMGITLLFCESGMVNYLVITVCCFMVMVCSTIFTVQMMSFVQAETPQNLIGKVMAVIFTICMCAQPVGNVIYGILFEVCKGYEAAVILSAGAASMLTAVGAKHIFREITFELIS